MPNRILKESICVSDSINDLDWFGEVLFYRLIVNCDDYGRFDGRTAVIKNRLFPLKDSVTLKNVDSAINKLARVGLVVPYEAGGKPFLFLPTWNEHQNVRAKRSKYPEPENICNQMYADECKCPRNPIQSESLSESNPNPAAAAKEDLFERFWKAYPKKVGKGAALKAFEKSKVNADLIVVIEKSIEQQKKTDQWKKENGQFIPNPATWLNQKRWEDEPTVSVKTPKKETSYSMKDIEEDMKANLEKLMREYGGDM